MATIEQLLCELLVLAPVGARISVTETLHSSEHRDYSAAVFVDDSTLSLCPKSASAMIAIIHYRPTPASVVAEIGAQLAQNMCRCVDCRKTREPVVTADASAEAS